MMTLEQPNNFINKVICGDCLEVMKDIPDKSIDLVLTDPPYNLKKGEWDSWKDEGDYMEFSYKWLGEVERVLKENGSFYFFHSEIQIIYKLMAWQVCNRKRGRYCV